MEINSPTDTITALATPFGSGAVSLIRISGPEAITISDKMFNGRKSLQTASTHTIHYGQFIGENQQVIDDGCAFVFRAPKSYTGEDSVELSCHGNPLLVQKIVHRLVGLGCRLAQPGEFSKRAFLNGKLDLVQAEAVMDIISARTSAAARGARTQLNGALSKQVNTLRTSLLELAGTLELDLDFAEEDIQIASTQETERKLTQLTQNLDSLLDTYAYGKIIKDGVNVALAGQTNTGKSSLLNYLLKESRAIVSAVPGTTRDIVREELSIDGVLYHFHDTAGIRQATDSVEKIGIERSYQALQQADIVIFMSDATKGFCSELYDDILDKVSRERIIKVFNKCDLAEPDYSKADVALSVKTGNGVVQLLEILREKTCKSATYSENSAIITNIRHKSCLENARKALKQAQETLKEGMSCEFIAVDVKTAIQSLEDITGTISTDDTLNHIFDNFCIGK